MYKGNQGQSIGTEISAEAEMDSCKNTIPHISSHILSAKGNDLGAACLGLIHKQADKGLGGKLHHKRCRDSPHSGNQNRVAQCQTCPVMLSGADILGRKGRYRGKHGGGNQKHDSNQLFHNADCRRVIQSPLVGNDGNHNKGNLDKTFL